MRFTLRAVARLIGIRHDCCSLPRVKDVDPASASPTQRELFEVDVALFGEVLSATRVYALQSDVFRRVQDLHATLVETSTLPARLVVQARMRVAEVHESPF